MFGVIYPELFKEGAPDWPAHKLQSFGQVTKEGRCQVWFQKTLLKLLNVLDDNVRDYCLNSVLYQLHEGKNVIILTSEFLLPNTDLTYTRGCI